MNETDHQTPDAPPGATAPLTMQEQMQREMDAAIEQALQADPDGSDPAVEDEGLDPDAPRGSPPLPPFVRPFPPGGVRLWIPDAPQGKQTARASVVRGKPRMRKHPETRKQETKVGWVARAAMAGRPPIDQPVAVAIVAVMPIPSSWSMVRQIRAAQGMELPRVKPDASNICKLCEDACNGIVFRDDSLVAVLVVSKVYGLTSGVHVAIHPLAPPVQ